MARILIIGGSLGGLFAANMLLRDGHDVHIMERTHGSLDGRGAGIVTHRALDEAMLRAGHNSPDSLGVAVESRVVLAHDGNTQSTLDMPQVLTSWSRLYSVLKSLFPAERYHSATSLRSLETVSEHVYATLLRGDQEFTEKADLLIACDGIRSNVRAQLAPHVTSSYAGYIAWRGVCDEAVLSKHTQATLFNKFGFGTSAGEQILGYPVAGPNNATEIGKRCYNTVWYRTADVNSTLIDLMTEANGSHHPLGISPDKVADRHITKMRHDARLLLAPQFAEVVEKTVHPFFQPIHDLASKEIAFGRVALLGDAAFVARPHVGMGVTKAGVDASVLADCIRQHGPNERALSNYAALRLPAGLAIVERARRLGDHMQGHQSSSTQKFGSTAHDAAWVLLNTAVDLGVGEVSLNFVTPEPVSVATAAANNTYQAA
jgi:2-polyprenyl-6-methoxyphenol hydroxylase-like FAD-dependent oxidoreductase